MSTYYLSGQVNCVPERNDPLPIARATGHTLGDVMRERIFEPLDMRDTAFFVPEEKLDRFGPCFMAGPDGQRTVFDPVDGQWSAPAHFESGGAGLVSTVDDFFAFAGMLRRGGEPLLSRASVREMTTNQLTDAQLAASSPDPSGALGWGFGLAVHLRGKQYRAAGSYGWDGGLGPSIGQNPAGGIQW